MNSPWQHLNVGNVAAPVKNALVGGPFGSNLVSADYVADGIPVIRGENLGDGRWVTGEFVYVSPAKAQSLKANLARPGDIVFTQRGTLGQVAIVPHGRFETYLISQSQMKLTPDKTRADALFLFYVFTSPEQQDYVRRHAIQTGVPHTNLGILRNTPIPLPSLSEQQAIAGVLGTLDDEIELSRRMNETLEAMARAIFKSWFVDFDPVRAKAEGRRPSGMHTTTAALFPSAFEDSPLGKIPKGWKTGVFGDVAENPKRGLQPRNIAPGTPYIALDHMPRRSIALSEWGMAEEAISNKFQFLRGEFLFGKLRPYFHKVGVAPVDGVCSTDILVVRPREENWYGLVLGHLSSDEFVAYTDAGSTGTKMPRTSWPEMARYEICVPDSAVAEAFNRLVAPTIEKIRLNILESKTLDALRNALLPKLISGEIRLSAKVKAAAGLPEGR
jgi:type I restriction enzyme S subunit